MVGKQGPMSLLNQSRWVAQSVGIGVVIHGLIMAEYELYYFDIRGRAQPIRYLFIDQGIQFKDTSVDPYEKWQSIYKPMAPFGLCPVLKDGEFLMAESNAILRYLGRKHGLHPDDIRESARADMINDNLEDIRKKYTDVIYYGADKEEFIKSLQESFLNLETQLNAWKYDYVLPKITFVDYNLFDLLDILLLHSPGCLDKFKSLTEYHSRIANRPALKKYRESEEFKRLKVNYIDSV